MSKNVKLAIESLIFGICSFAVIFAFIKLFLSILEFLRLILNGGWVFVLLLAVIFFWFEHDSSTGETSEQK